MVNCINLSRFSVINNFLEAKFLYKSSEIAITRNLDQIEINRHSWSKTVSTYMLLQDTLYRVESIISREINCMLVTFEITDSALYKTLFSLDHSKSLTGSPLSRIHISAHVPRANSRSRRA